MILNLLFSLLLLISSTSLAIQSKRIIARKIDSAIQHYTNFSGGVLVTHKGKVIIKKCYGYANYELDVPNTTQTKFRIASLTKSFTAVAIMQLQERGLLNVQDTLSNYIAGCSHGDKITVHHLLTHTSGIPNYYKHFADMQHCTDLEDVITTIKYWPLEFEPGSNYSYSNSGYLLLAYIIEKVSGKTYEEFLHETIFKPLNMCNSGHDNSEIILKNRAYGYQKENTKLKNIPPLNNPLTLLGNGDLYSSLDDMRTWDQALSTQKIISPDSLNCIFTPHIRLTGTSKRAHGYGWFIDEQFDKKIVEYSGGLIGFLSKHVRFIDDKVTIIILTNVEDLEQFDKIYNNIRAIMLDK